MAKKYDLSVDQGATYSLAAVYAYQGAPYNLAGYTARMMVKRSKDETAADAVVNLTTENGGIAITPLAGRVIATISSDTTDSMTGQYFYDLELVSPSGFVTRLVEGWVVMDGAVTK